MSKLYKKGFYLYDPLQDDFIPVLSNSNVFTDIDHNEFLPQDNISDQTIYRKKYYNIIHNGESFTESDLICYQIKDYDNIQISSIGIIINGEEILWRNLTDEKLEIPIENYQIIVTHIFDHPQFIRYGEDEYDNFDNFTLKEYYRNFHNPTKEPGGYIDITYNDEYVKKSTFLNTIFPTGTILFTYNKVSPATYIGGEWELIEEGYYPVSTAQDTIEVRLLNAELPNIKGSWGGAAARTMRDIKGAFTGTTAIQHGASWGGSGNDDHITITPFDASNGQVNEDGTTYVPQEESVYKNGGKVQPKSILLYMWRRVDNGTLTYNFINISFSENDFIVDPTTGQISLRNAIYYYTPNNIPKADSTGKLIDSGININDIVLKTRKVAGISLDHDITEQEIQNAIKDIEVELKNKTINADNNDITNLETDNLKDTALAKSTDNVRSYESSVDTKVTTEKFLQKTLRNIPTPTENTYAVNKKYVDDEIQKVVESTFTFTGFISTTEPSGNLKAGMLWLNASELPTTFPVNVKTYDGTNWSATTSEYTPKQFDTWSFGEHGYYWFGNEWNILDTSTSTVDNTTIDRNNQNELEVKDDGITKSKLNSNVADNDTLEKDATNGLRLKDEGITFAKFNPDLTKQSLANDYYFKFSDGTNTYYTKTITDGENIDVYAITIANNKITAITLQEAKGTLANGVLTFSSVEYAHNVFGDGFYVVGDDKILITISALQDILEKAGKVNDVKVAGVSQVKNKEANIQTIDNVEDNFYYAFKNGSTYYYTKSKALGSTAYYQFTYTDSILTKIENKGNVTVELNANRVPQITISSTIYTLDETKNDYYIINPKQKLPSVENETRDFTQAELDRIFEGFYITPPNPSWKYVGALQTGSTSVTVGDDWNELLLVMRVQEGSSIYNLTNVIPKYGFTYGPPTGNNTFIGFFWNESYNCKMRIGLQGTGVNRAVVQNYVNQVGWSLILTYVFKR